MSNLRGSLACLPVPDKGATHTVDETIKFLEKKRDRLQAELTDLVEVEFSRTTRAADDHQRDRHNACHGAHHHYWRLYLLPNAKQVSRYLGICPHLRTVRNFGKHQRHINRNGETHTPEDFSISPLGLPVGSMPNAKTPIRFRQNGKSGKLAMIAVANKLIRQAFAVVAHDKEYIDGFVSNRP